MKTDVLSLYQEHLSIFDFCDISYINVPRVGMKISSAGKTMTPQKVDDQIMEYPVLFSTPSAFEVFMTQRAIILRSPNNIADFQLLGNWPEGFFYGPFTKCEQDRVKPNTRLGINGEAQYFSCYGDDEFVGIYTVFSKLQQEVLIERLSETWIKKYLDLVHFQITRAYPSLTNPNLFNGKIKKKTREVIELAASGLNSKDIADILHLSERGVIYHIERGRELLNAKNKTDLIRIAKECCLI